MASTRLGALVLELLPMLAVMAFIAGALWAGILFSVSWLSGRARWMTDGAEVGSLAIALNRRWATPLLVLSLTSAALWLCSLPVGVLAAPSLVALGVALAVLLLVHSSVALRALRIARGSVAATRGEGVRRFVLVISLTVLTTLVGLRLASP